jgi:hypothetical protein
MPLPPLEAQRRFAAMLQDGRADAAEVRTFIEDLKAAGGVDLAGKRHLHDQFFAHQDQFEAGQARPLMSDFIEHQLSLLTFDPSLNVGDAKGRVDLPDPAVLEDHLGQLSYDWLDGQLFIDGATADDVVQGQLSDCYFHAAVAAIAERQPGYLESCFREEADGSISVRFYSFDKEGQRTEHWQRIDAQLPMQNGRLRYGRARDPKELWLPLLEKAYAAFKGDYDSIGYGGASKDVMEALLGRQGRTVELQGADPYALFRELSTALAEGQCLTADTAGKGPMYLGTGVSGNHMYTVTGVSEEDGVQYVHLRNPWGVVEPKGNGPDDGRFKLTLAEFQKMFVNAQLG